MTKLGELGDALFSLLTQIQSDDDCGNRLVLLPLSEYAGLQVERRVRAEGGQLHLQASVRDVARWVQERHGWLKP